MAQFNALGISTARVGVRSLAQIQGAIPSRIRSPNCTPHFLLLLLLFALGLGISVLPLNAVFGGPAGFGFIVGAVAGAAGGLLPPDELFDAIFPSLIDIGSTIFMDWILSVRLALLYI